MNITGALEGEVDDDNKSGAFYTTGEKIYGAGSVARGGGLGFDASRSWTGWTSTNGNHSHSLSISSAGAHTHSVAIAAAGAHTHAITIGKTGSGAAFSILPPYIAVYMWRRTA